MSDTLYRINPEWLTYYRRTDQEMIAEINDEFGVHGEGINSMVPLVPAKIDYEAAKTCESCRGTGIAPEAHGFGMTEKLSCPDCRGTGQWINDEAVEWVLSQALGLEGGNDE